MPNNFTDEQIAEFSGLAAYSNKGISQEAALATWNDLQFADNNQSAEMRKFITNTFSPTPNMEVAPNGVVDGVNYDNLTGAEELQDSAVSDRSYLDYSELNIPMSILRSTPSKEGEEPTTGEIWEAATYRHWLSEAGDRVFEQESGLDEDYRVSTEDLIKYNDLGYTDEEIGFISESVSQANFGYRIERIKADRDMKNTIERGGLEGTGLEMLASITDPALLPTLFLGGTVAASAKWRSAKAIGASMLSGSSQNVATEYLLKMGDTQRTDEDLMLAASMGALFSGTITAGAIGLRNVRTRTAQANQIEAPHVDGVTSVMDGVVYNKADSALATENASAVNRKRILSEKDIVSTLQRETGSRADNLSSKKIKEAKQEFRDYRKGQVAKIDAVKISKLKPKAMKTQVDQLQYSINKREQELNVLIADNNLKLATNSNLDALQQGKIPKVLQERYNELKKELGEMTPEPQKNLGKGLPPKPPKQVDENGTEVTEDLSVGAMQTRRQFKDIQTHDALLPETEIDEIFNAVNGAAALGYSTPRVSRMASKAKGFRSLSTQIDSAGDDATRGIGIQVFKNGTRTIEGHQSAEELAETLFFRNTPDYMMHESAFDEYAKAKGLKWYHNSNAAREEFNKQVVLLQASHTVTSNVHKVGDDSILQAAKARSRIYERSLKNNKDYGVIGFEKIEHSHSYHSVVYNADNILGSGAHADNIVDVIAKAYETGGIKLTRKNAVRLAETQLERTFSYRNGSNGTFKKVMSEDEFKFLDDELRSSGVDATTIAELKSSLFNKEDLATMSPRAMFSLKPDLTAKSGDVRMVDLIDTSIDRTMKYASDSGANAGLAQHGYKSRNQVLRAMEEARSQAINDVRIDVESSNPKIAAAAKVELARLEEGQTQKLIDDGIKLMYREPLEGAGSDTIEDISKILRKQTSITRLRSTGLMSLPENAIAMVRNGAMNTLRNLPQSRYFNLTKRSIEGDKFMNDFANTFSATGHQEFLFGSKFYNNSDFDDATKSKMGNLITKFQGKAITATMTANAFRSIQHGGEEMVARSIVSNLKELAVKGKMTKNIRSSLVKVGGLSEAQVDEMITHFKARPDVDVFDSVRQMPPELYNSVSVAARNTIGSSFMRMGIGESVPYANREMGKVMTSLLNFSIGSWEKMVVRGFKSDGAAVMTSMFAGQAALALLSQYAYVYSRAQTMSDNKRAAYIEKNLNDEGLFWGVFNRVGFLAAPAIPLQMLASANLLPEEISASPTKAGISEAGIPSVSMGADLFKAAGSAGQLIKDKFSDEYMSNQDREKNWKNIRRVTPWIDSFGYNVATGVFD